MQSLGRAHARPAPRRADPAPSYWAYKMQRLWLTPVFRLTMRVGVPVALVAGTLALVAMDDGRRAAMVQAYADLKAQFQARPEFRVELLAIEGASPDLADAVRARLGVKLPVSSFDLDLDALRQKAEELDAVAAADLAVRAGGTLQVTITERDPALIWRQDDLLTMIDATGHRVAGLQSRADRPDLPVVAGEGADAAAAEALALLDAATPLLPRLRGLVRVGERRWDIVLDRNQRILLPEALPVQALERLLVLDQADDLLARDLAAIDLRNARRPVLRLAEHALTESRRARGILPEDPQEDPQSTESDL